MNSPTARGSPKFKNLCLKHKKSPIELKDKIRKNYKEKVHSCRELLLDRFRGPVDEQDISNTLTDIYKSAFISSGEIESDELEVVEELKSEFVQEELEWWLREYEKSQLDDVDWSSFEQDENVICPICQKCNIKMDENRFSCINCKTKIKCNKTLPEIKAYIMACVDRHSLKCMHEPQFTIITDTNGNDDHIFIICDVCSEINIVV